MNIFEDLIEELKEENLIETTVIEAGKTKKDFVKTESETSQIEAASVNQEIPLMQEEIAFESSAGKPAGVKEKIVNDADFYRKRAMEEVAFLQMVEAAFAGVERDQMKTVPQTFDDLEVKKILHTFLNAASNVAPAEQSQAEFQLLQATEGWYSTLAYRDKRIMAAHLRRYCETSRPPLSAPALIALARFYRNSPYTEQVRSKFDLMMTKIFSKESDVNTRVVIFSRAQLVTHIKDLYADWSSVPLYSTEKDDAGIVQTVKQFEDFMTEATEADKFDQLINSNFFNRLRIFKESTNEDFYAPLVTAVGIESNIHIGNRYVELLNGEKQTAGVKGVENKYGLSYDHTVSEATGKTVSLIELLKQKKVEPKPAVSSDSRKPKEVKIVEAVVQNEKKANSESKKTDAEPEKIKKWLLAAAVVILLIIAGVYLI